MCPALGFASPQTITDMHHLLGIVWLGATIPLWPETTHPIRAPLPARNVVYVNFQWLRDHSAEWSNSCYFTQSNLPYSLRCIFGQTPIRMCYGKTKHPFFKRIKDHTTPVFKRLITTANQQTCGISA